MRKRALGFSITLCIIMGLLSSEALALAVTGIHDIGIENLEITVLDECTVSAPHVVSGTTTANKILVSSGIHYISLNGADIQFSDGDYNTNIPGTCAFELKSGAKVYLSLTGTNILHSGSYKAGLQVPMGAELIITSQIDGTLEATGGYFAAGIGAGCTAIVGENRNETYSDNDSGAITITGGTVTATGISGAGIGGRAFGQGSEITISGGFVSATGGNNGAGIGGGFNGQGSFITISGGMVNATGISGAGIGGGGGNQGREVIVSGGTVNATSTTGGAGIGGGYGSDGSKIAISGGTVNAISTNGGAGIGGVTFGQGSGIIISGGTVNATGISGAGIGGGSLCEGNKITINGGFVSATSAVGAGIGGGSLSEGSEITISGGIVNASTYAEDDPSGVGIGGGGYGGGSYTIVITGGTVTATSTAAQAFSSGAGIGSGGVFGGGRGISSGHIIDGENAVVFASSKDANLAVDGLTHIRGILFKEKVGETNGSVSLSDDFEVQTAYTLFVPFRSLLTIPSGKTLTNKGTIINEGTITNRNCLESPQ